MSLVEVVEAAVDSARPGLDAKNLRLNMVLSSEGVSLMGDPSRLQQVFWNLITNATKFTPKGGSISVVLKRIDSALELSVIDSGQGIEREFLPHIFERFTQADPSSTRSYGGLGLGLSISKSIVEMHGGTISVESEGPSKGATIVVRLPVAPLRAASVPELAQARQMMQSAPFKPPAELRGLHVLVVEDEIDSREMVVTLLERCGAIVRAAGSAADALIMFDTSRPDVLVSDIGMPAEDGYSLIRRIRQRAAVDGGLVPASCLTAYASAEDRRRSLIAGFNLHVAKPIDAADFVVLVENLGRLARALR